MRVRAILAVSLTAALASSCTLAPERPGETSTGLPPLYRKTVEGDREKLQALFPLFRMTREPGMRELLLFPFFWDRVLTDEAGRYDRDWAVLPLLIGGSDADEGNYLLLFPILGNTRGLLGYDEMRFVLFPLYAGLRQGEYRSTEILWPLISWGEGEGRTTFRFWPFYSRKDKEGESWSRSVLWPLVTWGEEDLQTEHPTSLFFLLPFYGETQSDVAWSRAYLYPFFTFAGNEAGWSETNILWPFYRRMTGPDPERYAFRLWPFYGITRNGDEREEFVLWPFYWDMRYSVPAGAVRSRQIVPFYRSTQYLADDGSPRGTELQVWPLFRRRSDAEGAVRLRVLAPIPFTDWEDLEGSVGWAWTLLDVHSDEEREKVDLLGGLLGYESTAEEVVIRLLWLIRIPF